MPHRALACALVLALGLTATVVLPVAASAAPPPAYVAPVDAPVVDPFRAPSTPYGAGNRGLEYGTAAGTEVRAAAGGVVTFAGVVAGSRHVTILHPDGLRTTYSFLDRITVVVGQRVRQGEVVGTTVGSLHFSARRGSAYLDPASLLQPGAIRVRLVPFDDPPGDGPGGERSAIRQLIGGIGGAMSASTRLVSGAIDGTEAVASWLRAEGTPAIRTAAHYMARVGPGAPLQLLVTGVDVWSQAAAIAQRPCTARGGAPPPPPPGRRIALLVAGLGSSSERAAIDDLATSELGYDASDVLRFSYAGGRVPDPTDGFVEVPTSRYGSADTQGDLRAAATKLAELIEAVASVSPDAPIDLYAHSQGGLVTRLALLELERRHGAGWLDRLGLVATLGTPHGGADLATAVTAIGATSAGSVALDGLSSSLGLDLDDDAPVVAQLAETSELIAALERSPLPPALDAVSIAARGDLVVPVPRTRAPGFEQVVVPVSGINAHDALPGSVDARRELALALAGAPPTCTTMRAALLDQLVGETIGRAEDAIGSSVWLATARAGLPVGG